MYAKPGWCHGWCFYVPTTRLRSTCQQLLSSTTSTAPTCCSGCFRACTNSSTSPSACTILLLVEATASLVAVARKVADPWNCVRACSCYGQIMPLLSPVVPPPTHLVKNFTLVAAAGAAWLLLQAVSCSAPLQRHTLQRLRMGKDTRNTPVVIHQQCAGDTSLHDNKSSLQSLACCLRCRHYHGVDWLSLNAIFPSNERTRLIYCRAARPVEQAIYTWERGCCWEVRWCQASGPSAATVSSGYANTTHPSSQTCILSGTCSTTCDCRA